MPNWIDAFILVTFGGAICLEFRRGFGRAVFDVAALLVALRVTWMLNETLSGSVRLAADPDTNRAVLYAAGFIVLSSLLVRIGKAVHAATLVSTDVFDPALGALCGAGIATMIGHVLVQSIDLGAGGTSIPSAVAGSWLGTEFLRFDTYHEVLNLLYNFHRDPVV